MKSNRSFSCMQNRWIVSVFVLFTSLSCTTTDSEIRKEQAEATRQVGEAYMQQGDYTSALKELLKSEELYSRDPYLHNALGFTYMQKQRPDLAIAHFRKAIKIKPDFASARNSLGTVYLAQSNWDEAIKWF
ncbi:MAG: tetratricopeptide repeat protein, partial [Desulfobacterales bacterium]